MLGKLNETEEKAVLEFKKEVLEKLGNNVREITLFGSKARGDYTAGSDVDLLVVIKEEDRWMKREIIDVSTDVLFKLDVFISPKVMSEKHYLNLLRLQTGFIKNIQREGIKI